ncbi:hypothetical protein DERP_005985 [Dermatophagoides pteronyssinus]|uniref:Uncharacterized protein n=1 Tax=Dermatophagoides pteronyssinus TaxID=6956 RepID=A0ABQ8JRZ0_DERPT|nr:hypothetical protein DERP_005985 [Dermatophagoides pteronyssinus]
MFATGFVRLTSCDNEPDEPSSTNELVASIISSGGPLPHENCLGIRLVGIVVINCPHTNTPTPKNIHHAHCSSVSEAVLNGRPPNWTIITWKMEMKKK